MVHFGHDLAKHAAESGVPVERYVDYKRMKKALKHGTSVTDLQNMYMEEMQKLLEVLGQHPETTYIDPLYLDINRKALDKIS